jgi:hypothetical protein
MEQTQRIKLSEPPPHLCQSCGGLMRLIGSEAHPVKAYTDLLTYVCTACDEFLVLPEKIMPPALRLFDNANGFPEHENTIAITRPSPARHDNSHATLITCDKCGGNAHLVSCEPCHFALGIRDTWIFQCEGCGNNLNRTVER